MKSEDQTYWHIHMSHPYGKGSVGTTQCLCSWKSNLLSEREIGKTINASTSRIFQKAR